MQKSAMQYTSAQVPNPSCSAPPLISLYNISSPCVCICVHHPPQTAHSSPPSCIPSSQHIQHQPDHLRKSLPPARAFIQPRAQHDRPRLALVPRLERAGHRGGERLGEHVDVRVRAAEDGGRGEVVVWKEGGRIVGGCGVRWEGGERIRGGDVEGDVGLGGG